MNSDYLSKLRELHESKCKQQVEEEKTACKEATMALLEQTEKPYNLRSWTPPMFITFGIILLICLISMFFGPTAFFLTILAAIIPSVIAYQIFLKKRNRLIKGTITQRERDCEERIKKMWEDFSNLVIQDEKRYKRVVEYAQLKYGASAVINPVVEWLCDQFILNINATDQRQFITHINTDFRYRVDNDQITVLKYYPHSNTYNDGDSYKFVEHSFFNLPDLFDQIGCALALSKLIEFEILRRISDAGKSTENISITQDSNDNTVTLKFSAPNPAYIAPINLDFDGTDGKAYNPKFKRFS